MVQIQEEQEDQEEHTVIQGEMNLCVRSSFWRTSKRDGDSPIQSIVTVLHERTRKGIMDGLRSFIEIDNHCAMDLGHLRTGSRPFHVQKPNFSEVYPEAISEGADDLALRAEEVKMLNACFNVDHIEEKR